MITKACSFCGKEFKVSPSHANKRFRCSRACYEQSRRKIIGKTKECSRCKRILPRSEFYKDSKAPGGIHRFCKSCHIKANREWRSRNREKVRIRQRNYQRKHRIGQSGKDIRGVKNKRLYPEDNKCELCHKEKRLVYHHWNNKDFSKGMWICTICHTAAHWLEQNDPDAYYKLKIQLSQ